MTPRSNSDELSKILVNCYTVTCPECSVDDCTCFDITKAKQAINDYCNRREVDTLKSLFIHVEALAELGNLRLTDVLREIQSRIADKESNHGE